MVSLKSNVGHQRAIAIGLQYINAEKTDFGFVVVLDSDGEDSPEHIRELVAKCDNSSGSKIIFAKRKKRQESAGFKIGYFFYRYSFYMLTGQKISFGNFSCIPRKLLQKVVLQDNLWNHFRAVSYNPECHSIWYSWTAEKGMPGNQKCDLPIWCCKA